MKKILIAACIVVASAVAADRIVYVDFERIYRESKVVGAVNDDLTVEFSSREDALEAAREEIQSLREELEKETLTLNDAERAERERRIVKLERDFVRDRQAYVEDRTLRFQERRKVIDAEIARLIAELAQEQNYTIVLNPFLTLPISGRASLNHNIILYANPESDITEAVIELFDQKANISR